jgi:hypothetical protein
VLLVLAAFDRDQRTLLLRIESGESSGGGWHSSIAYLTR